uniref:Uncharacterized protein n=1 Tax=Octopus bimaculoides TaxID=37653 RepID=A0A0L8GSD0_OCTBM
MPHARNSSYAIQKYMQSVLGNKIIYDFLNIPLSQIFHFLQSLLQETILLITKTFHYSHSFWTNEL